MLKFFSHITENKYIHIAGILALLLSPFVDAIGGNSFWWLFYILLLLFVFGLFDEYKKNKKMNTAVIHIPIIIKIDDGPNPKYVMNNIIHEIEKSTKSSNYKELLEKYFNINLNDFIFVYENTIYDFDRLMSFTRIIKYNINRIEETLNGRVKFHIAYYKRPAIGFLLGTIFRTESLKIYQNNDFENRFLPVANINSRAYKERMEIFSKYTINKNINNLNNSKILITIESASHNIAVKTSNLQEFQNIINIKLNEYGTIPYESDWIEYTKEIYNIINEVQTEFYEITIAHAMPEAISIILGMSMENYWNINITQYENNNYKTVFNMKNIKYFSY